MRYEKPPKSSVPVGTVRSRPSRGREALRRLMGIVPDRRPRPSWRSPLCIAPAGQRFPGKADFSPLTGEARYLAHSQQHRAAAKPVARSALH
jgi:hypothetical protein